MHTLTLAAMGKAANWAHRVARALPSCASHGHHKQKRLLQDTTHTCRVAVACIDHDRRLLADRISRQHRRLCEIQRRAALGFQKRLDRLFPVAPVGVVRL